MPTHYRQAPDTYDSVLPLDAFRAAIRTAVVSLNVQAHSPGAFQGALWGRAAGDVHVLGIAADAHSVHRTESLIREAPQHFFKFTLVERGAGLIVQGGRETALASGDMTFYDTDRPYSLVCAADTRISVVMFPKDLLGLPADLTARLTATKLGAHSPVGAIVRPYVASLSSQISDMQAHPARRMCRGAIDMISALIEDGLGAQTMVSPHGALMRQVLAYIEEHLASPELSPPMIASAHFISVRHLHAIFNDQGTTVSTVIRNRRLERCYDQLIDPRSADRSVTAIALENGFVDAAHFSRTFRAHYGVPPSVVRPTRA
ncbi:helix-turn-helix domain-containing protein [Microbacterium lushaniae]|uniref:Helix-turn-helix domain-containing protein n=1 Tax=Microbacterium lushaniae TaxID=2614639 RepID=A0A5J6L130_9MICO|nr:helix-turn-helix domain-containing protein [Microbacterium lushaniae]QEW02177.1 helix-turn-helix domain-containing protein [Microbacterium lushaniae]